MALRDRGQRSPRRDLRPHGVEVVAVEVVQRRVAAAQEHDHHQAANRPIAEHLLRLSAEHPQVRGSHRVRVGPDVGREIRRLRAETVGEERPHFPELGADGGLCRGRDIAEEHEHRLVAVVGQVRQRSRDLGEVRLERLVELVDRDAEDGLERLLPSHGGRRQLLEEVHDGLLRRVVDEPVHGKEPQVVADDAVLMELSLVFDARQRREIVPDQRRDPAAEVAIHVVGHSRWVGDHSLLGDLAVARRSLDQPRRHVDVPIAAQGVLQYMEVLVRVDALGDAPDPYEDDTATVVPAELRAGPAAPELDVLRSQRPKFADVALERGLDSPALGEDRPRLVHPAANLRLPLLRDIA